MRVIGLDYGTKTVGVAVSDETKLIAQPLVTIERKQANKLRQTYAAIEAIIAEQDVELIVLGNPKNMNNTEGERVQAAKEFKEALERRTGLPVVLVDERLTTVEANRILEDTGVALSARKEHIDKMAAAIILQNYLDMEYNKKH
ncbi:MAG: Holliday junction resolvase RuvX [Lachnospiraceae bacterium]|nr:Holliday junction resolvase RuvX [Lachnospiraceae bacterium]